MLANYPAERTWGAAHRLAPMLDARSIAVVGVSERANSFGLRLAQAVTSANFSGRIDFINPRYESVLGQPCRGSLGDLDEAPDLAILGVGGRNLEQSLLDAIRSGAKSAVIFDACNGNAADGSPLLSRLKDIASEHGIAVCGGAGMGLINVPSGCVASFYGASHLKPGGITLIAHSGSVFTTLAMNDPRYRFDLLVSPGQEIGATIDEYIDYAVSRESTKVIAVFMETARNPTGFQSSLKRARQRGIPVVVCKVGRSEESARMARSHTGALAGSKAAYEAVLEDCGAISVQSIDELMNVASLCSTGRLPGPGGAALMTDSGGLRELAIDLAAESGARLARFSNRTVQGLRQVLPQHLEPSNPLDCAADLTDDFSKPFEEALTVLSCADEVSMVGLEADLRDDYVYEEKLLDLALSLPRRTDKPCFFYSSFGRANNFLLGARLIDRGIPCINGIGETLNAISKLQEWSERLSQVADPVPEVSKSHAASWQACLSRSKSIDEYEALALLSSFGVPVVGNEAHDTLEGLKAAAKRLGYPVAVKTAAEGIDHKSDVGGVLLNIRDDRELEQAYGRLTATLGPRAIIQNMSPRGIELAFGCVQDPDFGSLVMVSAGGTLVEHFGGQQFALAPFGESRALELIGRLPIARLLDGVRGSAPADKIAAARALSRFSVMCAALGDTLKEADVNPIVVTAEGAMAVDALVVPAADRARKVA
ncbi:acyl-CoA synthetase (NDP forming) [Mesorhizobium loti]|uniref:Acyl-CoA synthetase (NDP forming) n=1 Tax=Rhizobium loti TaxID=381 RepID=A0A8E3B297_RHILI|nr:acetate--CoA ligase family protein [Mesorhizobium loti]PWJ88201.1 acyl-CoA synthetase (NDP forming) [Mesorhizobium loti]